MRHMVYLAGPITGLAWDGATSWRDLAIERLADNGIRGLSPLRGKHYLGRELSIADKYDQHVLSTAKAITTRDRWDCTRADLVIANFIDTERVSIGSVMEIAWADAARVPVILVMEDGNIHDHAMVREVSGFRVETIDEAIDIAISILGEDVK